MEEAAVETEIQAKGLTAPRITPAQIEATIVGEYYFTAYEGAAESTTQTQPIVGKEREALSLLTFCVLLLQNGFTVTGESACASPANFDAELGRKIARGHARDKIWALEGYLLKERIRPGAAA